MSTEDRETPAAASPEKPVSAASKVDEWLSSPPVETADAIKANKPAASALSGCLKAFVILVVGTIVLGALVFATCLLSFRR